MQAGSLVFGGLGLAVLFSLYSLIDLLTVNGYVLGRIDPDSYLVAFDSQHGNSYIVPHHQCLADPACQYQHCTSPSWRSVASPSLLSLLPVQGL